MEMTERINQTLCSLEGATGPVNVGRSERIVSAILGGGLLVGGLSRGSFGGLATAVLGGALLERAITGHCRLYQVFGADTTGRGPAVAVSPQQGYKVEKRITIHCPPEQVFQAWTDLEALPQIMSHLSEVRAIDDGRTHWVAKGPLGTTVAWDAEVIEQRENELVSWRSLPDSQVDTAGSVHFQPARGGSATTLRVSLKYNPPAGKVGGLVASFLGEGLEQQLDEDLAKFKETMEARQAAGA